MQAASKRIYRPNRIEWFGMSGLSEEQDHPLVSSTRASFRYAARLSRYISDPSTVRVRVLENYGRSPPVETIRSYREHWLAELRERSDPFYGNSTSTKARAPIEDIPEDRTILACALAQEDPAPVPAKAVPLPRVPLPQSLGTAGDVIDACADAFDVSYGEIIGTLRERKIVQARNLCAAILRARGNSFANVGRLLGGRDHSTTIHNVRTFFIRDIRLPKMEAAWMSFAPCLTKAARSIEELEILCLGVRR